MATENVWSPGSFMNELFSYYDAHASSPHYFVLSSGINLFPMTQVWRELIHQEIEQMLAYPFYTSPLGFPASSRAVMVREIFAATEGRVTSDEFVFTPCMTIGAAQAVAMAFAYLATDSRASSVLLLGLNHPIFEQLARHYHFAISEMIGEQADSLTTLPRAEVVAQAILEQRPGIVVLVHPNNPSGEIYTEAELATIFRAARQTESLLLLDQVGQLSISYEAWVNINKVIISTQTQAQAILVQSFSKSESIPGFRAGYLAVPPAMEEFAARFQQLMIMNPQTILSLPIFLSSLARCLFLGTRMKWLNDERRRYLARFFSGLGALSLGELPSPLARQLSPSSLLELSERYMLEHLKNYETIRANQCYMCEKLQRYITRRTELKGGFNCLVEFEPFAGRDEFTVCREIFQATRIALLPESSFRVYRARRRNFWVRVSLAVPEASFQEGIDKLAGFLARPASVGSS